MRNHLAVCLLFAALAGCTSQADTVSPQEQDGPATTLSEPSNPAPGDDGTAIATSDAAAPPSSDTTNPPGHSGTIAPGDDETVPPVDDGVVAGDPADVGLDAEVLRGLLSYVESHGNHGVHSVLVHRNGVLVLEEYYPGTKYMGREIEFGPEDTHYLASVSKSVTSVLVGIAIDLGLIESVETFVEDEGEPRVLAAVPGIGLGQVFDRLTERWHKC